MLQLSIRHPSLLFPYWVHHFYVSASVRKPQPVVCYVYGVPTYRLRFHNTWRMNVICRFYSSSTTEIVCVSLHRLRSVVRLYLFSKSMDIFLFFLSLSFKSDFKALGLQASLCRLRGEVPKENDGVQRAYQADQ